MPAAAKWLIVVLIAALPVVLIMSGAFDQETESVRPPTRQDVIYFAKEIVKKRLRDPETAIFQDDDQIQVETLAENQWRVAGSVEAKTGVRSRAGVHTTARYPFSIVMEKSGSRWKVLDREPDFNNLTKKMRDDSWTNGLPGTK